MSRFQALVRKIPIRPRLVIGWLIVPVLFPAEVLWRSSRYAFRNSSIVRDWTNEAKRIKANYARTLRASLELFRENVDPLAQRTQDENQTRIR